MEVRLASVKAEVKEVRGDEISLEVCSDRLDMLSTEGVARSLKGVLGLEKGCPKPFVKCGDFLVNVDGSVGDVRPYIGCAVVRDVSLSHEALVQVMKLQEKLHETYCRGRRKASIGVYDADRVKSRIFYKAVEPRAIAFTPLDYSLRMSAEEILKETPQGVRYGYLLKDFFKYPLLIDEDGLVLSMPPIVNSEETRVKASTRNIFIDVTGVDEGLVEDVLAVMAMNIVERGGFIEKVSVVYPFKEVWTPSLKPRSLNLDVNYANRVLGLSLSVDEVVKLLEGARYDVSILGEGSLSILIPPYRCDVLHQVDVVEDLAMAYGYERMEPEVPLTATVGRELPKQRFVRVVKDLMIGMGFQEVLNYMMTSKEVLFKKMGVDEEPIVEVLNPLTIEYSVLRSWLLPSLINFLSFNLHVEYPQKIFECGDVVIVKEEEPTKTRTITKLAAAICNHKVSYEDIQSVAYALLSNIGASFKVKPTKHKSFIEGRVAEITSNGEAIGLLGEIHPQVLENFNLTNPVVALEINITSLEDKSKRKRV